MDAKSGLPDLLEIDTIGFDVEKMCVELSLTNASGKKFRLYIDNNDVKSIKQWFFVAEISQKISDRYATEGG